MNYGSRRYFTPLSSEIDSEEDALLDGNRAYAEPDSANKAKYHIIRIWPSLPSQNAQTSVNYPTA